MPFGYCTLRYGSLSSSSTLDSSVSISTKNTRNRFSFSAKPSRTSDKKTRCHHRQNGQRLVLITSGQRIFQPSSGSFMERVILARSRNQYVHIGCHSARSTSSAALSKARWLKLPRIVGRKPPQPAKTGKTGDSCRGRRFVLLASAMKAFFNQAGQADMFLGGK